MDSKHDKKKESIDEILSDLNGLLNKMPSILDGIKMPEMQPTEVSKPAQESELQPPQTAVGNDVSAGTFDADKTVVLEPFSGLSAGSQVPVEIPSSLTPESASPGQGGPVPRSPDGFMFGQEAESEPEKPAVAAPTKLSGTPLEPPPDKPVRNTGHGPSLSVSEFTPSSPKERDTVPQNGQFNQQMPDASNADEAEPEKRAEIPAYETSRDFGIPDVDALIRMSEGEKPAVEQSVQSLPEAGLFPEPGLTTEAEKDGSAPPALADNRAEAAPPVLDPGELVIALEVKPETSFEAFTIEPSPPEPAPAQDGGETLRLDPAPEDMTAASLEPPPAEPQGLQFGSFSGSAAGSEEVNPEAQSGAPAAPEAEPMPESGQGVQFGSDTEPVPGIELGGDCPAQSVNPGETLPGNSGLEISGPASQSPSGDETLVAAPPAGSSGEEEKTVIFQASPSTISRAQTGDLSSLAARQAPESIPAERVRALVFLYSPGDEALCAAVLMELDAICLKSAAKPMFVKRAYVKECDVDSNANFVHQSVADSGAAGLICLGAIPQEKVYEIENAFASSGGFFRYYDSSSFTHSAALDLVADLIVR